MWMTNHDCLVFCWPAMHCLETRKERWPTAGRLPSLPASLYGRATRKRHRRKEPFAPLLPCSRRHCPRDPAVTSSSAVVLPPVVESCSSNGRASAAMSSSSMGMPAHGPGMPFASPATRPSFSSADCLYPASPSAVVPRLHLQSIDPRIMHAGGTQPTHFILRALSIPPLDTAAVLCSITRAEYEHSMAQHSHDMMPSVFPPWSHPIAGFIFACPALHLPDPSTSRLCVE